MAVEVHRTTCVLDCPDTCALEVEVREGRVERIGGRRDHPDTAGFICGKVAAFGRRLEHPDRLLHPMRRVGPKGEGRFERVSWPEAIVEITERFEAIADRSGAEAILPFHYGGSNGSLTDGLIDHLYFARLGASRLGKTICALVTTEVARGMYGKMPGVAFEDYPLARCIVIWGANPRTSNIHLVPYLRAAKRNGAFIAAIDPRRNFPAAEVDLHLPVLPGADLPVALALAHVWRRDGRLDERFLAEHARGAETLLARAEEWTPQRAAEAAGVEAADIERLAGAYAGASPAVVRCGWGPERNRNGASAIAAILALPALLGKFGVRGGGYTLSNSGGFRFDPERLVGAPPWRTRMLNMTRLGSLLTEGAPEPPIEALFVYNANPAATVPHQETVLRGLGRDDLYTVVFEQVMTDTARYADLLLPAVTFLEGWDLRRGYGSYVVGGVRPVVEPAGEARTNMAVFAELGRAMGWSDEAFTWSEEEVLRRVAAAVRTPEGAPDGDLLAAGGMARYGFDGGPPVQFGSVVPATADGRADLAPPVLGPDPYRFIALPDGHPLALVTPASSRLVTSTLGEFNLERLEVSIHPRDARRRGIAAGDAVRVFNGLGQVVCRARLDEAVRPGVASMPKGAWRKASENGASAVAVCPDHVSAEVGGACFNDARVEVERV